MRSLAAFLLAAFVACAALTAPGAAVAQQAPVVTPSVDGKLAPFIARAPGKCIADPATMRRYHMQMLMHQRTETVHEGVRPKDRSLEACLTCHAVKDAKGEAVGIDNPKHFCRSCHTYAAVKIDCFECHNSRPPANAKAAAKASPADFAAVTKYLQEIGR